MPAIGYIQVHAYTSRARLPLKGAIISVSDTNNNLLAVRITDESGLITPIAVSVPNAADSRDPNFVGYPFIEVNNVQVFAGVVTLQNLEFVPLEEYPSKINQSEDFNIPPQNL